MDGLVQALTSWPLFLAALLIFGLLPGALLRLIVLLYPKRSSDRREIIGELYRVPRWERPFWVLEQLETAVCEGLPQRLREMPGVLQRLQGIARSPRLQLLVSIASIGALIAITAGALSIPWIAVPIAVVGSADILLGSLLLVRRKPNRTEVED